MVDVEKFVLSPEIYDSPFTGKLYPPPCRIRQHSKLYNGINDKIIADPLSSGLCLDISSQEEMSVCNLPLSKNTKYCDVEKLIVKEICLQPCISKYWVEGNHTICEYDLDLIDDISQAKEYTKKFGINNSGAKEIFKKACFLPTNVDCPINPATGLPMNQCAYIRANNYHGEMCRDWFTTLPTEEKNLLKKNFCLKNPRSEDCKCLNRGTDKEFQKLSAYFQNHDSYCWYYPCNNSDNYMIEEKPHDCNSVICQTIFDLKASGNLNLSEIFPKISCGQSTSPPKEIPKEPPTFFDFQKTVLGISVVILIVIILMRF